MNKWSLRNLSVLCLALWAAIWFVFLSIRFSSFDVRIVAGIGPIMLAMLVIALLAPVAAIVFAGTSLLRQPRMPLNWLALACAVAVFLGQGVLFAVSRWL